MKKTTITEIITLIFVLLFLYTGISKSIDYSIFREQLALSPILKNVADWVAIVLPAVEIIVAIVLFIPFTRLMGLYASLVLMLLFTGYIIYILNFNAHLPCSCGGVVQLLSWKQHLVLNTILVLLSLAAIILSRRESKINIA